MKRRNMREVRRCTGGEKQVADIVPAAATEAAIAEAAVIFHRAHCAVSCRHQPRPGSNDWLTTQAALAAAAPVIAAQATTTERERLEQARQALLADGYFTDAEVGPDIAPRIIERLSVIRAEAVIAEQERIIALASQLRAQFPADHPKGAMASFADYLRVTSGGDL